MKKTVEQLSSAAAGALLLLAILVPTAASAHTVGDPEPFHLAPGDYFEIPVSGGTFASTAGVVVRFTPVGGGAAVDENAEDVVANISVGVRVPAALAVGEHDVEVILSGTPSDPPAGRIWVRERPFRLIQQSTIHLPNQPPGSVKDTDFGDLDNDGFLDVFEAGSPGSSPNIDRLEINQLGRAPGFRDCAGTSFFCDQTTSQYENSVAGVPDNDRTYDADLVDLDLDGDLDIVRIDRGSARIRIFLNDGTGTFVDRSIDRMGIGSAVLPPFADISGITNNTAEVDSGDVDGDSRPDLIMCAWNGSQNVLLLNRLHTTGDFVIANDDPCNPAGAGAHALCKVRDEVNRGCAFGEFNGDSQMDIILPSMQEDGTHTDRVLLNTGNVAGIPQFSVEENWVKATGGGAAEPFGSGDLKVADLDGDGDDDVVIAAPRSEEKRRILWNDDNTRLVELADARYAPNGDSYDVSFADLDRDGDLDLMFTREGGSQSPVMINKGGKDANMLFEEVTPADLWFADSPGGVIPSSPSFSLSVSPGDYDLDGDIDLLTGGGSAKLWQSDLFDQPGEDRDWVFVLDRTRSMISGGKDFFEPAKNVIKTFLAQRRPGDEAGLVTYDYTGVDTGNPNAADDVNKAQIESDVGVKTMVQLQADVEALTIGTCSGFCTAIGWALKTGKEVAEMAPDPDREKVLVLVTDGRQNQSPHPDTIIPTIPSNILVYTIALGSDTDDRMLSALATNGGKFYFAGRSTDYTSVQSGMRDIDNDVEGHATGKQPLIPLADLLWSPVFRNIIPESGLFQRFQRPAGGQLIAVLERREKDYFVVDPADAQVRFTLNWRHPSETNRMTVIDPKGRTYPLPDDETTRERRDSKSHVFEIADPLSGIWTVVRQVSSNTGPSKLTGMASTDLRLTAEPEFPLFYLGESCQIQAAVASSAGPLTGASAQARVISPSKQVEIVSGQEASSGVFTFSCSNLAEEGSYQVEVLVLGPPSRPFTRSWTGAIHVAVPTATEPDLRSAELTLDQTVLTADGSSTAIATLRLKQRDGSSLPGAQVSFVAEGGSMTGAVQDNLDGSYSQTLRAGTAAGRGAVRARVGLVRLPNVAEFRLEPGSADESQSEFTLLIGDLKLCSNEPGSFELRVAPVDAFGNPIAGAVVEIDKVSGPGLSWGGPVQPIGHGEVYERSFLGPVKAGAYEFAATVNGVSLAETVGLDVFAPDSAEGLVMGCFDRPEEPGWPWWWWLILLLLLLLIVILVWWLRS